MSAKSVVLALKVSPEAAEFLDGLLNATSFKTNPEDDRPRYASRSSLIAAALEKEVSRMIEAYQDDPYVGQLVTYFVQSENYEAWRDDLATG